MLVMCDGYPILAEHMIGVHTSLMLLTSTEPGKGLFKVLPHYPAFSLRQEVSVKL